MRRPTLNLLVDGAGFCAFVLLTASGVLVRYVLPPGSGRFTTLWGLDRHEWGGIHFWIAIFFFGVLAVHLVLHGRWIVRVVQGRPREGSSSRLGLGVVGLMALLALATAPFVSPVEQESHGVRGVGSSIRRIDGSMTLREVEQETGVPAEDVVSKLGLPPDVSKDERLGRLRRRYGFTIESVRRAIEQQRAD